MDLTTIPASFKTISDNSGIIQSQTHIALKCCNGHPHKYPKESIGPKLKCPSCVPINKLSQNIRVLFELILDSPLIISSYSKGKAEFANPRLKVMVTCINRKGKPFAELIEGKLHIVFYKTQSDKLIRNHLWKSMSSWPHLTSAQEGRLYAHRRRNEVAARPALIFGGKIKELLLENC
jgi:hypothetical protein